MRPNYARYRTAQVRSRRIWHDGPDVVYTKLLGRFGQWSEYPDSHCGRSIILDGDNYWQLPNSPTYEGFHQSRIRVTNRRLALVDQDGVLGLGPLSERTVQSEK
jgi:hypothetical protein